MARPLLWAVLLCVSLTLSTCAGIHLELTHVDAKEKCSVEERLRRAAERTHRRLASMAGGVTAPVYWAGTEYIAEYLIGNPPVQAEAIIDSGSNLVWTQCAACSPSCFTQNLPIYDPSQSSTFQAVACNDTACALGSETQCAADKKTCAVDTSYGSGNISGALDTETFAFGSENVTLAFGCVTASKFTPPGALNNASGIIGLGRGNLSLVKQLGDTKFSYCLTPYFIDVVNTSHLFVGASAALSGGGAPVTSVPFVENPSDYPFSSFYYLPLAGITVGEAKLDVPAAAFELRQAASGYWVGTFIDSGTSYTSLADVAYQALRAELEQQLGAGSLVPPPAAAAAIGADLCVAGGNISLVPNLTLNFGSGGGDVVVPPENYWAPVDTATETACMVVFSSAGPNAMLPMNETTVIGNYMQQNMHLLYDLGNGVLSFQTADCTSMG